jgi:hypothetical protein
MLIVVSTGASADPALTMVPNYDPSYLLLRDTLFVLDSSFIEVRLDQQAIYQHFRGGRVRRYLCSTGDPRIKDGIATREGIFTVQWKSKRHMSKQFEVPLNYWMPFDGGIGFHGLQGRSYYRYLGRRASSHGCVRVSNETGAQLFRDSPRGTVVLVHSGAPARVVAFGDTTMQGLRVMESVETELLRKRLRAVTTFDPEDSSLAERLAVKPRTPWPAGVGVGRVDKRAVAQKRIPVLSPEPIAPRDRDSSPAELREPSRRVPSAVADFLEK